MREIKFRGKSLKTQEWLYGSHFTDSGEDYIIPQNLLGINDYEEYQADQNTVGQFTGLLDKNDKEIYEGDIVRTMFSTRPFGVIVWHSCGYFYVCENWSADIRESDHLPLGHLMQQVIDEEKVEIEVIGNIHDNPELIKHKED